MPFKSKKQKNYLKKNKPKVYDRYQKHSGKTGSKKKKGK